MAFWGIEVKPGKPYTHRYDESRGRLRICQATLGNGKSASKIMVQCNVGNKTPILLCSLIPEKSETCPLELEFEEDEEVVFSVLGQMSAHLSGFYIGRSVDGDETDSYGEDIADTDTSGSSDGYDDEDEYESNFIDDDVEMYPHSPRHKSGVVIEEIVEDEKPQNGNSSRRRLKKKHQLNDSDDGNDSKSQLVIKQNNPSIFDSEDEDGFPTSFSAKGKVAKGPEGNSDPDGKIVDEIKKQKLDAISGDGITVGEPDDTSLPSENNEKLKKKKKISDGRPLETVMRASAEERVNNKLDKDQEKVVKGQNVESSGIETDVTVNDGKRKKGKNAVPAKRTEEVKGNNEALNNDNTDHATVSTEPEKLPTDSEMVDSSVLPTSAQESSAKSAKKKSRKRKSKGNNSQGNENNTEAMEPLESKVSEQLSHEAPGVEADKTLDVNKKDAKKKKSKNNEKDSASKQQLAAQRKTDESNVDSQPHKTWTFPDGLIIEDLATGKPDGKEASDGRKVFVNYIGKLKNGTIFDSNVGQRPFKFRLGAGQVIKGWDIGVKGMRVGDKRRLTIPPSFGYGEKGAGKKIPGNSWLVFDVELVNVQ